MVDFLIVRNKCDPATEYTNWVGDGLRAYLEAKGHTVQDLSDAQASPQNVDHWLNYTDIRTRRAAILLDHGSCDAFYGERNGQIAPAITRANAEEMAKELHVYTLACSTNGNNCLGQTAVERGCYSWLGYIEPVYAMRYQPFKECIWSYIEAMADGKTIEQCEAALRKAYDDRRELHFVFGYNLDRMLLRKSQDDMTINSHCREPQPPPPAPKCFIATAAFGSRLDPHVQFLREFRDEIVLQSVFKTAFELLLDRYYKLSPPIAEKMREISLLRRFVKYSIVYPFVICARGVAFLAIVIRRIRK